MHRCAAARSTRPLPAFRTVLATTVAACLAGSMSLAAVADASPASHAAPLAPVIGTAKQGGAVIVWLTDQHSNLNLRTQGAARTSAAHADQKPIVEAITAAGGTDLLQLVSVNAVAAHVSAAEVQKLRAMSGVRQIVPDSTLTIGDHAPVGGLTRAKPVPDRTDAKLKARTSAPNSTNAPADVNPFPTSECGTQADPLIEPEADLAINAPAMTNQGLSTEPGHGVVVANDGISIPQNGGDLVGNPNFVRPAADGGGSVVVGATPGDTTDSSDGEYYGDASSIAAQGTVEYQYSKELPYSNLPDTCYFKLVGDAPGASLVDTGNIDTQPSASGDPATTTESRAVAAIDAAVIKTHADVINESYGYSNSPGSYATHYAANDAAVAAGVTVVVSSGDSGVSGTVSSPATDPLVIAAGATNTLRENAMAYGFADWVNNDITPLSSGGTSPNNKLVDLVAPGYGGEAACNPAGSDCPTNTQTEAFGGTSQAAPLIAGAAADVIQAFRDSHNGDSPSPALVKQILTGTATDVNAPADQQGAGLVNIGAAVSAAQQIRNTTVANTAAGLLPTPTQLDLTGAGGSTGYQSVSLYNASNASTTVTGTYRSLGAEQQLGGTVTENVSAPDPAATIPADGAQAAPDVYFNVPSGLDRLDADMIWPDATNSAILNFVLTDPHGRLRQISYDYGAAATATRAGTVPDIEHVEVAKPEAGTWKAQIKWANGRSHLQELPNQPGTYRGSLQFKVAGQNYVTTPASPPVTIAARSSATIPLAVDFPTAPGDHPESVQFTSTGTGGVATASTSLPIARRTLIPSSGGEFDTTITSTVGRGIGQISSYDINVPAGRADLGVTLKTPDASADNPMTLYLVNPSGASVATHTTTTGTPPRTRTVNGVLLTPSADGSYQSATFHVANPAVGTWEVDVALNLTTSGKEFTQTVVGDVLPQAPTITSPVTGSNASSQQPTISGTGAPGDTVTVSDATGKVVCTSPVDSTGAWSCTPATALVGGPVTLTATQADQTGDPSSPSAPVTVNVPATASVTLSIAPSAPRVGQPVTLTATTTNVPDGTTVSFSDGSTSLGSGTVLAGTASHTLPNGLSAGDHELTASVPATDTSLAAVSPTVDVVVSKTASTIALTLSKGTATYGSKVTGSIKVAGATGGTATVSYDSSTLSVPVSSTGTGTFALPVTLTVGKHTVTARYDGTSTVASSATVSGSVTITKAATTTNFTLSKSSLKHGAADTVSVKIAGAHAGALYPGGTVTVTAAVGTTSKSRTVNVFQFDKGAVSFAFDTPSRAGTAKVTVTYSGDGHYTGSSAPAKTVTLT